MATQGGGDVAVLVHRGWVPQAEYGAGQLGSYQTETGVVQVDGYLALSQPGRGESPEIAPQEIYRIDLAAMEAALPYELLPVILMQSPTEEFELEPPLHAAREVDLSEGPHLSYAWQWFIFCVLTGGLYLVFVRRSERERPSPPTN
jgi:surfeit locus 1 family protein